VAKILIAEDDERVAAVLVKSLRSDGHSTVHVDDGEQAERLGLTEAFDLMILDMGLPERDGFQVLRGLRSGGQTLPVIILTGRSERDAAACLEAGADDYMRKPFHVQELLARVRRRLQLKAELDRLARMVGELQVPDAGEKVEGGTTP
jgi:DNA-binding response OmpR family regulator